MSSPLAQLLAVVDIVQKSEAIFEGEENYIEWCKNTVCNLLSFTSVLAAGGVIVPQIRVGSGTPVLFESVSAANQFRDAINVFIKNTFPVLESISYKESEKKFCLDGQFEFVKIPVTFLFDNPIGCLWAIVSSEKTKEVQLILYQAATLIAEMTKTDKSSYALNLLARPIWKEADSIESSARAVAEACFKAVGCDSIVIWKIDRSVQPNVLRTIATEGQNKSTLDMVVGKGVAGVTATNDKCIRIDDLHDKQELLKKGVQELSNPKTVEQLKWRSAFFVPLDIGGAIEGVVAIYATRTNAISKLDEDIVSAFAQRLASTFTHIARIEELAGFQVRLEREAPAIESGILAMEYIHDAYNALGIAQGYIGLIAQNFEREPNSTLYKYSKTVSSNIDHALKQVKIVTDGADISKTKFSNNRLKNTFDDVMKRFDDDIERYNIVRKVSCPTNLKFEYDKSQIDRVIKNIVENAIFFLSTMPSRQRRILIGVEDSENDVTIWVEDNGPGIDPRHMKVVFDYLHTTKGGGKGMGFGLAIAKRIVEENHGGTICVDSEWGVWARFTIVLPKTPQKKEKGYGKI